MEAIAQGNPLYIKLFSAVAFFILLIAGINYINLTTARAFSRLKEIAVRKTIGAIREHLIRQFLLESLLVTFISFLLALLVLNLFLPPFNEFVNKKLSFGLRTDYRIWLYSIGFIMLMGFLSGSYPALLLSRFKPTLLLKGLKLQNKNDLSLRKGLVIFQFVISIVMIVGTIVLFLQVRYLNNTQLGFNKDLLLVIDVNTGAARTNFEAIKTEMSRIPTVKAVSATSRVPGEWKSYRRVKIKNQEGAQEQKTAYLFGADKDFLKTFEINLVKGRNFNNPSDSASIIVNETAAKMLNITEAGNQLVEIPEMSSGQTFEPMSTSFKPRVVGIVKDFHFQSLHNKIEPLVLAYNQNPFQPIDYYSVRIDAQDIQNTLGKLKAG